MDKIFYILLLSCLTFSAKAQDSTETVPNRVIVTKNDGSVYTGELISDDAREIFINSDQVGKLYIPKHTIKSIKPFNESANVQEDQIEEPEEETPVEIEEVLTEPVEESGTETTEERPPEVEEEQVEIEKPDEEPVNYITTKNIVSDNAMPIQRGESFVKFTPIGVEAGIPLTKNWSLGGFSSYWGIPVGIKTKYCFELANNAWFSIDAGYGTMAFGSWADLGVDDGALIASTSFTIGERDRNFTIKTGYGFIHEAHELWQWDETTQQIVSMGKVHNQEHIFFANFGGMLKLTPVSTFTFEALAAYMFGSINIGAGAAVRFGRNPRRQWQLGGSLVFADNGLIPIPFPHVSYTMVFSKRKRN